MNWFLVVLLRYHVSSAACYLYLKKQLLLEMSVTMNIMEFWLIRTRKIS